jgi:hypothetical protein
MAAIARAVSSRSQPAPSLFLMSRAPDDTPRATDNPNSNAVPVPMSGTIITTGMATIAAPTPASTGAKPF